MNRRLRDTVVFSGLFGAVPRATVRATSANRRPTSTSWPALVATSVTAERTAAELLGRTGDPLTDRAEHQLTVAGLARRDPDVLTELRRLLGAVGDDVADLQRRHAVHQRLVRLGVDRDAVRARPSIRYISHSGRDLSSGREPSRAMSSCSCASLPGDGSADRRMW